MIEPDTPTTIWIKHPVYPAFLLADDEGKPLKPSSVILRHRHLRQQQRIIQSGIAPSESSGGKLVRRTIIDIPTSEEQISGRTGSSTTIPSSPPSDTSSLSSAPSSDLASAVADNVRQTGENQAGSSIADATSSSLESRRAEGASSTPRQTAVVDPATVNPTPTKTINTSIGPLVITRQERTLRARGNKPHLRHEKTVWYFSSDKRFMDVPPHLAGVTLGELYVHEGPEKQKQVWTWSRESSWQSLQIADPHPYLSDYILNICSNGEPSWVTKETLRTYQGRIRKREVDQRASQSRQSSVNPSEVRR